MAFALPKTAAPVLSSTPLTPAEQRAEQARMRGLKPGGAQPKSVENLSQTIAQNMQRWHADPWAMIQDGVIWTLDEVDMENPIKRFPAHPWLEQIVREWQANKLLLIPKSRRMMMSWLMIYLHLWLTMWHPGVAAFMVSQSERKSADLIKKAKFIFNHIPESVVLKPKLKDKQCLLEFPGLDSYLMGIPEGEDQLRQYTATALMFDEFAFWERPMESLSAAKPCITGGGRLTIVSTPGADCFYNLAFDQAM